jgi:farnesyl-diphosphate farnesyltransferase
VKSLMLMGPILVVSNSSLRWLISQVRTRPFIWGTKGEE